MLRRMTAALLLAGGLLVLPGCGNGDGKVVTPQVKDEIKDKVPNTVAPAQPKAPPKTGST